LGKRPGICAGFVRFALVFLGVESVTRGDNYYDHDNGSSAIFKIVFPGRGHGDTPKATMRDPIP
jgi:hypothetical protein